MDEVQPSVSIRRKSKTLGLRRQTYHQRKSGHRLEEEDAIIADLLHATTKRFIAWGFWMVFHFLRKQGHPWNHKKVYRIWKLENLHLRIPPKRARIRRKYLELLAPEYVNEGWAMDFLSDWVVGPNKQKVRIINVMDECSRKALWTQAHTSIKAHDLTDVLDKIVQWRGAPSYIRCDNGPEFISQKLSEWAKTNDVELRFIQPGKPSQNGLIERLNGTLRKECLNLEWFESIEILNEKIQEWWNDYNEIRPHSSIAYNTPNEFEILKDSLYFQVVAA